MKNYITEKPNGRFRVRVPGKSGRVSLGTFGTLEQAQVAVEKWKRTVTPESKLNARLLLWADLHAPYHHVDALYFLDCVRQWLNPTRVLNLGDELDCHALGFYPTEPDLLNATDELHAGREIMAKVGRMFPRCDCVESNHTSRPYRMAKRHGIPKNLIVPYETVVGVDTFDWQYHKDMCIELPNGEMLYLAHHKGVNTVGVGQGLGMSYATAHQHKKMGVQWWQTPIRGHFALDVPCLIDETSSAFGYDSITTIRPALGCAVIINGVPMVIPMNLENGRWDGKLPDMRVDE